jgi:hypothetical protein
MNRFQRMQLILVVAVFFGCTSLILLLTMSIIRPDAFAGKKD